MRTAWTVTAGPDEEPVSIEEIKAHLRITHSDEDGPLLEFVIAARRAAEAYMARGVMAQTVTLTLGCWADEIPLPRAWPLQSVESIQYAHPETGVMTTLADTGYDVDTTSVPGRVLRAPGQSWPGVQSDHRAPIQIAYVVGAASADLVDGLIRQGIRMHAAYLHFDREGMAAEAEAARRSAERFWTLAGCLQTVDPVAA